MKRILSFLACALLILNSSLAFAGPLYSNEMQRRADAGNVAAIAILGYAYAFGDGISQDHHKASAYWLKAISHPEWNTLPPKSRGEVYLNLGINYVNGRGVRQDYHKAGEYYRKAADLGQAQAMYYMGSMYYRGLGVRQDYRKAKKYFGMACDHGFQSGCDGYRKMNERGLGNL